MSETKVCSKCKAVKPLAEFHRKTAAPDGLRGNCKTCASACQKEYRRNPPPPRTIRRAHNGVKQCSACQRTKLVAEFHRTAIAPDGLCSKCKACQSAYDKERYRKSHTLRPSRQARNGKKRCSSCKTLKLVTEFGKSHGPDGLRYDCKRCRAASFRLWNYGITKDEWRQMFADQSGVCKICGRPETVRRNGKLKELSVDHDHKTGDVRGLLCDACNHGVGCFRDDASLLHKAGDYLSGASALLAGNNDISLIAPVV